MVDFIFPIRRSVDDHIDVIEDIIDNKRIETESDSIIDFTEVNPFGEA